METTNIYCLFDPRKPDKIRYIGKSDYPEKRVKDHIKEAKGGQNTHRAKWIRKLLSKKIKPEYKILEIVPEEEWQSYEITWIAKMKSEGHKLTNATLGGEGTKLMGPDNPRYGLSGEDSPVYGSKRTLEQKARMSKAQKKSWKNNEERRKSISGNNNVFTRPEIRKKYLIGDNNPAKRPEVRAKISKALMGENNPMYGRTGESHPNFGKQVSQETRDKISKANIGYKHTEEAKKKIDGMLKCRKYIQQLGYKVE